MGELLKNTPSAVIDVIVYSAIVLVMVVGLVKCIFPMRRLTRSFRRSIRSLQKAVVKGENAQSWRSPDFLGSAMQKQWQRFLTVNEQLEARGLNADTENYINDESVLVSYAHMSVNDTIPGLLTSLGILGTFIGLMRGVSGLDVTGAEATMASISQMIGGMTFAYGTSIAGLTCSLIFNVLSRMSQGSVTLAMDEFHEAFHTLVMKEPLDDVTHRTIYLEDQAEFLRRSAKDLNHQLSTGIVGAVRAGFEPVNYQLNQFMQVQTQGQMEVLGRLVGRFLEQLDGQMGGQLHQLGRQLSALNQAQTISVEGVNRALESADKVIGGMNQMNSLTATVIEKFDSYLNDLNLGQQNTIVFAKQTAEVTDLMRRSLSQSQSEIDAIKQSRVLLDQQLQKYASFTGDTLQAVQKQAQDIMLQSGKVADSMLQSQREVKTAYAGFAQNLSDGFSRALALFEESIADTAKALSQKMQEATQSADLSALSRMEEMLAELNRHIETLIQEEKTHA